jgi:hypothetical protein
MSLYTYLKGFVAEYFSTKPSKKLVFDHHFFELKYYLRTTSCIENFAHLVDLSIEEVDHISIADYGVNFATLINKYRCLFLIKELDNPINSKLSFESIVNICGFENIESFVILLKQKNNSLIT